MTISNHKTALVTGATSGLGFEAAAQLAAKGYTRVTITGRSESKAAVARARLIEQTGRDIFEVLAMDLNRPSSVAAAADELRSRGASIDLLLLNAGMVAGNELTITDEGIEVMTASSLIGHHQLTMRLIQDGLVAEHARIVIAGSEAARGDVMNFKPVPLRDFATEQHDGDVVAAAEALMRFDVPIKYTPAVGYANAKAFVAQWSAALARRLPAGVTVNAVSPGSAPDTDAGRNAPWLMKQMIRFFSIMPGKSQPVDVAAKRYLDVAEFPDDVTGEFFASAPKKITGDLHQVDLAPLTDRAAQEAVWEAVVRVSGGVEYPVTV